MNKKHIALFSLLLLTVFFVIFCYISGVEGKYAANLMVDITGLGFILVLLIHYTGKSVFEPIYFITIIYAAMYFVAPIYDILTGEYYWFGYDLFQYGVKSTIIALIGYIAFYIAYTKRLYYGKYSLNGYANAGKNIVVKKHLVIYILLMYLVCFAGNAYYLIHSGYTNMLYILSLGLIGDQSTPATVYSNIGFISMLSYSLPTVVLLYWEFGSNRLLKILLFVPMLIMQVTRGFRFFVIQIFITFICYFYLRHNKKLKIGKMLLIVMLAMVFVLLMTMFRVSIRSGEGMALSSINTDIIKKAFNSAFLDNLRIYQNFYGMIPVIPETYNYVWGRQIIIGTIVMMVPRRIWPQKISSYGGEGLKTLIGAGIASGQAYPTLGEYYYAAGVFGVILLMGIYGSWAKAAKTKYMTTKNPLDIITFSVLLGCNLQLMIRGYFPSNFWYIVFALFPIWITRIFFVYELTYEKNLNADLMKGVK